MRKIFSVSAVALLLSGCLSTPQMTQDDYDFMATGVAILERCHADNQFSDTFYNDSMKTLYFLASTYTYSDEVLRDYLQSKRAQAARSRIDCEDFRQKMYKQMAWAEEIKQSRTATTTYPAKTSIWCQTIGNMTMCN
ncbi:hypothetical protein [Alteromonas sp. CYL-A6]|uniref:hypothetical protein n=1 Tax=Alteromonas nitratireducens TaxID=3390813 RepID=UPI0034BE1BA3